MEANLQDYAVDNLQYQGAYPAARLSAYDAEWTSAFNFHANLTAFSMFKPHDINMSTYVCHCGPVLHLLSKPPVIVAALRESCLRWT